MQPFPEQLRSRETFEELYVRRGLSIRQVAKALGVGHTFVRKWMVRVGVERRPQMQHPSLRRDFFDRIDSAEKAYVLGLLWADGTMSEATQQVRLRLAAEDAELLERVRVELGASKLLRIKPCGNAISPQVGLYLSSATMIAALKKLGFCENKDQVLPDAVPPPAHLVRDFVRGLVDGDGCLQFVGQTPRVSFRNRNDSLRGIVSDCWLSMTGERATLDAVAHCKSGQVYPSIYLSGSASRSAAAQLYRPSDLAMARKHEMAAAFQDWRPHRRGR